MDELEDKVLGGLLGVHAGDSLGATHEFKSWSTIVAGQPAGWRQRDILGGGGFDWEAGAATDDTDLTLAVLDAYLAPDGFQLEQAARNMLAWRQRGPKDMGNATRIGLDRFARSGDPRRAGAGKGSAGNGSLMRCLPTALARGERAVRLQESIEISAITHDDPQCTGACAAYNELASVLLDGATSAEAVDAAHRGAQDTDRDGSAAAVIDAIDAGRALDLAALADDGGFPYGHIGYVLHSLSVAVAAVLDPRSFEDVLVDVVHLGGDTDTNGAIAGGLLGARDGAGAIPTRWVDTLQYRERLRDAAPHLVALRGGAG